MPACSGEPGRSQSSPHGCTAYPRMRGGTLPRVDRLLPTPGLSPHARGNQSQSGFEGLGEGPIPACAGEPCSIQAGTGLQRAYPRMRGGTGTVKSPTMMQAGLSPHARGNPVQQISRAVRSGPIPACAGEPKAQPESFCPQGAYPRMRGGTAATRLALPSQMGLSPHARGNRFFVHALLHSLGPIPACAGEPFLFTRKVDLARAYPRMRGGTRPSKPLWLWSMGLSPHARGNQCAGAHRKRRSGPIPACAGEPVVCRQSRQPKRAYPRMRGGTVEGAIYGDEMTGLSPHARGNLETKIDHIEKEGPIPACAGEPVGQPCQRSNTRAYPRMRGGPTS